MRYLHFNMKEQESKDRFEILYDGLNGSTRGFDVQTEARVMGRVLDKLEAHGVSTERGDRATFALTTTGTVELEDAEFKLMVETISAVSWTTRAVRKATALIDWLETKTIDPPVQPTMRLVQDAVEKASP